MAITINADTSNGLVMTPDTSGEIKLQSAGADKVTITSAGNVGINTSSPTISSGNGVHINAATAGPSVLHMTTGNQGTTSSDGLDIKFGAGDASLWNYETGIMSFATSNTERMRIDSSGNVLVGITSFADASNSANPSSTAGVGISSQTSGGVLNLKLAGTNGTIVNFARGGVGIVGHIDITTSATTYATSSDYRLKENVAPMSGSINRLKQLKPSTW